MLNSEDWDFIYRLYLDWIIDRPSICNGDYKRINKIHKLGLIRKVKLKNTRKNGIRLTEEGIVLGIISCRQNQDFKHDKRIVDVMYW